MSERKQLGSQKLTPEDVSRLLKEGQQEVAKMEQQRRLEKQRRAAKSQIAIDPELLELARLAAKVWDRAKPETKEEIRTWAAKLAQDFSAHED